MSSKRILQLVRRHPASTIALIGLFAVLVSGVQLQPAGAVRLLVVPGYVGTFFLTAAVDMLSVSPSHWVVDILAPVFWMVPYILLDGPLRAWFGRSMAA